MFIEAATAPASAPAGFLASVSSTGREARRAVTMNAGATLFFEGDDVDNAYGLVAGVVRLSKALPDGRRQIVGFVFPGEVFTPSGIAFNGAGPAACTADAVTAIEVVDYGRNGFERLVGARPDVARALLAEAGRRLLHAQQQMVLLGRMAAIERLAWFLLTMARQQHVTGDAFLHLPMNRIDIADYLGLSIETVSRNLSRLRSRQLIDARSAVEVRIADWPRLRAVAEGLH